jgi:hypothetical protein
MVLIYDFHVSYYHNKLFHHLSNVKMLYHFIQERQITHIHEKPELVIQQKDKYSVAVVLLDVCSLQYMSQVSKPNKDISTPQTELHEYLNIILELLV